MLQKYKIELGNGQEIFFIDHAFEPAIKNNRKKYKDMALYSRNTSSFGPTWIKERE